MTLTIWKDNRLPVLSDTITSGGTAVDLTGSTVTLSMRNSLSAALKITGASATVVTPAAGIVQYAWAAGDVDTVGTYKGWWTVTTSGLTQDTPEFDLEVVEHAPASLPVPVPVGADGTTTIYQGDGYLSADGRALIYQLSVMDAPDLTGLTVTWRVQGTLEVSASVVGEDAISVDLTSAQTTALTDGQYQLELEGVTAATATVTLLRTTLTVLPDMSGP